MSSSCTNSNHSHLEVEISDLKNKLAELENKNVALENDLKKFDQSFQNLYAKFKNLFSKRQVDSILNNQKISRWEDGEILSALHIRYSSIKTYNLLKSSFPLPSERTLYRWAAKIECPEGYQKIIFDILKMKIENFDESEKLCVIVFDEIEIRKQICYDISNDKLLGPFSKAQVVIIRGLCSNWKQPLFFKFDFKFTKNSFEELAKNIQNIGLIPIATVCDFSPINRGLLKELNISFENPIFSSENLNHPTFFFADFPHMLKLLRNHFLDQGFCLQNGTTLNKNLIINLLKIDNEELKLCHKISFFHLWVVTDKM